MWAFDRPHYRQHRIYQPRKWWNTFTQEYSSSADDTKINTNQVMHGLLSIHCPSSIVDRDKVVKTWIERLEYTTTRFEVALKATKYEENIQAYWSMIKKAKEALESSSHAGSQMKTRYKMQTMRSYVRQAEEELQETIYEAAFDEERLEFGMNKLKDKVKDMEKDAKGEKSTTSFGPKKQEVKADIDVGGDRVIQTNKSDAVSKYKIDVLGSPDDEHTDTVQHEQASEEPEQPVEKGEDEDDDEEANR